MDENDFWQRLEFRICREFQGFADPALRWFWCDGLIAETYDLRGAEPCIRGVARCGPNGQELWQFTLLTHPTVHTRPDIEWSALLPGDHLTGWLTPDSARRTLTIDPRAESDR